MKAPTTIFDGYWRNKRPGVQYRTIRYATPGCAARPFTRHRTICQDCEAESPACFIVHDALWNATCPQGGVICVECFEKRLGRPLEISDLKRNHTCNCNDMVFHFTKRTA